MSKSLIQKASIYRAEIPLSPIDLEMALMERPYSDPVGVALTTSGFVPVRENGPLVEMFSGGFAFALRVGDKVIPPSAVREGVRKKIDEIERNEGRKPGRKEKKDITEDVRDSLALRAITRISQVTFFYHIESQFLFLTSVSQRMCDRAMSTLIHTCGTVKTTTIHVGVSQGLTTRLDQWLQDDEDAFGVFQPEGRINLKSLEKRTVAIKTSDLHSNSDALREALRTGHEVTSLRMNNGETTFTLSKDFKFTSIDYIADMDEGEDELEWAGSAYFVVLHLVKVAKSLCAMFGYEDKPI